MIFLDRTPKAQVTKVKIDKQNCIKPRSFCIAQETINRMKRQPTRWEKTFASGISNKGLTLGVYEGLEKTKKDPIF
jgi:hypothetical protein